jgi:hypothetical protein
MAHRLSRVTFTSSLARGAPAARHSRSVGKVKADPQLSKTYYKYNECRASLVTFVESAEATRLFVTGHGKDLTVVGLW